MFLKTTSLALLYSTLWSVVSSVSAVGEANGLWCLSKHEKPFGEEEIKTNTTFPDAKKISYRGLYSEFSLYVEENKDDLINCEVFKEHILGNDGMWIIEEPNREVMEKTMGTLRDAGLPIYYEGDLSFIVGGGVDVPNVSGLDGCGASKDTSIIPVPTHDVQPPYLSSELESKWMQRRSSTDPNVELAVNSVSEESLIVSVTDLQTYHTRNSYSETIYEAEHYLIERLTALGFSVETMKFRPDMSPNVIATWNGKDSSEWIVAGAHYDSRSEDSSSGTNRAPGADDNGTGSSAMLELAKIVNKTSANFDLERGLKLCWFSGEEQGLLGSRALAAQYKAEEMNIVAMVNADMLGYQATSDITLGFKDRSVTKQLVAYAKYLTSLYVPGLPTDDSSSCCSDYLSFWEEGFAAVGFFENGEAASNYPSYHTETDLITYVNTKQLTLETQAVAATVFTLLLD